MFEASWNGTCLARSDDVIEVEGRLYFAPGDVRPDHLRLAPDRSVCEWKGGEAEYFDIVVGDAINRAAAWRYPELAGTARLLTGRIAFWKDVKVGWKGPGPAPTPPLIQAALPNVAKALGAHEVIWRPTAVPLLGEDAMEAGFAGYLIPDLRVLVDVLATPPEPERAARVAEARARGEAVRDWNDAHADARYGYIAVWGSAKPSAHDVEVLKRRGVLLALTPETIVLDEQQR